MPAGGQWRVGELEQGAAVDGGEVDAAAAFEFAPAIVPVSRVERVRAAEVLSPGHVRVDQLAGGFHGGGREFAGYGERTRRGERVFDGIFTGFGETAAARRDERREHGLRALVGDEIARRDGHF